MKQNNRSVNWNKRTHRNFMSAINDSKNQTEKINTLAEEVKDINTDISSIFNELESIEKYDF